MAAMNAATRIDAWLARNGVWFMPATLGAFAVLMLATVLLERGRIDEAPAVVLPHRSVATAARRGTPVPPADTARDEVPTLPSAISSREGQVEVCSVGWTGVDAAGGAALDAVADAPAVAGQRREIVRLLGASGDTFGRASQLLLASSAAASSAGPRTPLQRLVEQATATSDPRVYAMAFRRCQAVTAGTDDAPMCRSLSASQWSRLDDGNALPWLYVLDEAMRRGDSAARDDALFRIARARRMDRRAYAVAAAVADVAGRDDAALVAAWTLGLDAIGLDAAAIPFSPLTDACRDATLASGDRRETCGDVADLLLERSDSLDAWVAGAVIARSLGRDTRSIDETTQRATDALSATGVRAYDCQHLRRELARWQSGAAVGQMAALR